MSIIRIIVGIVYWCGGHGGRAVCTAAIGLEGRRSRGIIWNAIWRLRRIVNHSGCSVVSVRTECAVWVVRYMRLLNIRVIRSSSRVVTIRLRTIRILVISIVRRTVVHGRYGNRGGNCSVGRWRIHGGGGGGGGMCEIACVALWSLGIRGSVIILVHSASARGSLYIATSCISSSSGTTVGSHASISGCRYALIIAVWCVFLKVYFVSIHAGFEWLRLVIFIEDRQANLWLGLTSLAVCLCLDGIEAHLFIVSIFTDGSAGFSTPSVAGTTFNAASANAIKAAAEEEKNPGDESEPNGIAD
jgi:hypothetical protein